ncbi:hypothetical protein BDF14DRAFT_1756713 [Spinellus fusiger]|nr:hypothetical protein BDF14DRAFT_1756713 [Spinellus fusiger]
MVSFQCDGCSDVVKKPKLNQHGQRCRATFTCIDCSTTFQGYDYQSHTSCISEAEKYQKALFKGKKTLPAKSTKAPVPAPAPATTAPVKPVSLIEQLKEKEKSTKTDTNKRPAETTTLPTKKQKKGSNEWSAAELDKDMNKNFDLALKSVLKEKGLSFDEARKKTLDLIESHPKAPSGLKKKDLKKQFDKAFELTFENSTFSFKKA